MKKITSLLFMNFLIAQVSISDINNINNAQLDLIKDQLKTPTEVSELGTDMDIQSIAPDIINISNSDEELYLSFSL